MAGAKSKLYEYFMDHVGEESDRETDKLNKLEYIFMLSNLCFYAGIKAEQSSRVYLCVQRS